MNAAARDDARANRGRGEGRHHDFDDGSGSVTAARASDARVNDARTPSNPVFALMRAVTLCTLALIGAVAVIGVLVGWAAFGMGGVWAALLALAALALYELPTQIVFAALSLSHASPRDYGWTVGMAWLVKIGLLIGMFVLLQGQAWFHHALFAVLVVLGAVGVLAIETWQVIRCRVPYVDPPSPRAGEPHA